MMPYFLSPHLAHLRDTVPERGATSSWRTLPHASWSACRLANWIWSWPAYQFAIPTCSGASCSEAPCCLVVSPTHPLASANVAEWMAFESERLLILKEGHCFRDQILTACTRRGTHVQPISKAISFPASSPWWHQVSG